MSHGTQAWWGTADIVVDGGIADIDDTVQVRDRIVEKFDLGLDSRDIVVGVGVETTGNMLTQCECDREEHLGIA